MEFQRALIITPLPKHVPSKQDKAKAKAIKMLKKEAKAKAEAKAEAKAKKRALAKLRKETRVKAKAIAKSDLKTISASKKKKTREPIVNTKEVGDYLRSLVLPTSIQRSKWYFQSSTLFVLIFTGLFIGAICLSSYNSNVEWYEQWCTGDMAALQLFNSELHNECQSSSSEQFVYQTGYIMSFGCTFVSLLFALPMIFKDRSL